MFEPVEIYLIFVKQRATPNMHSRRISFMVTAWTDLIVNEMVMWLLEYQIAFYWQSLMTKL